MKILGKPKIDEQIYQITTLVAGGFSLREVLDKLARIATEITENTACSIRLLNDETGELEMSSTFGLSDEYRHKGPVTKDDPVIKAAFNGEAVVIEDMWNDPRVRYPQASKKEGIVSQLTVSMTFKDKPVGVLRLYDRRKKKFTEEDVSLARAVASQCAVAIQNARFYQRALQGAEVTNQMKLAGVIQRRMIPQQSPQIKGLDVAGIYNPCFNVGGDMYDYVQIDEHTLGIAISDVIGKGVPAALMTSMFRGALRAYADGGYARHSLEEIIQKLNRVACCECISGEFVTLFYIILNAKQLTATYCNCGHEPALFFRGSRISELKKGGLVLGVVPDAHYEIGRINLNPDDRILMYTDGLIDAVNFDGRTWGIKRLVQAAKKSLEGSAEQMIGNILRYQRRFTGLARQTDDTSLVGVRITG